LHLAPSCYLTSLAQLEGEALAQIREQDRQLVDRLQVRFDTPMRGWLCPALFRDFDRAPERLYGRAEPVGPPPRRMTAHHSARSYGRCVGRND
jgi:hypothetical protein